MEPVGAEETNEDDRPAGRVAIAGRLRGVSLADIAQDMVDVLPRLYRVNRQNTMQSGPADV